MAWLDAHPDSDEEDSIDYLMEIMTDSQIDILIGNGRVSTLHLTLIGLVPVLLPRWQVYGNYYE